MLDGLFAGLAGVSTAVAVSCGEGYFREQMLFTHRGLSGPAMLQISSYWQKGEALQIDLLPGKDASAWLHTLQKQRPKAELKTVLAEVLPNRLAQRLCETLFPNRPLGQYGDKLLQSIAQQLQAWELTPAGTEGMRTAEVSLGGVDTRELSSKTMEARKVPGLYFIGETVDVTGWLGGYNFQWAWASGWCAGQYV
jgi:predicted Rossmann fold flavoprotein